MEKKNSILTKLSRAIGQCPTSHSNTHKASLIIILSHVLIILTIKDHIYNHTFFFPQNISFIVLRKVLEGYKMYNQKVLYTKEMVRARTRGDDISILVLERRM